MLQPDFTPPDFKPPKVPEWATYIPERSPKFKAHNNRGQAISAVNYDSREGWLYRLYGNKWILWAYKAKWTKELNIGRHQHKLVMPPERKCSNEGCYREIIDPEDYICDTCRKTNLSEPQ